MGILLRTAVSREFLADAGMNSSHSTAGKRGCYSTQEYRGNWDSFAGITAAVVRLFVCRMIT